MKKTIAILALAVVGITTVNAGVHFGINLGIPVPVPRVAIPAPVIVTPAPICEPTAIPAPIVETIPACPTPGYVWVGGSWGWCDNDWVWTSGPWGPPAHWAYGYYAGYPRGYHG